MLLRRGISRQRSGLTGRKILAPPPLSPQGVNTTRSPAGQVPTERVPANVRYELEEMRGLTKEPSPTPAADPMMLELPPIATPEEVVKKRVGEFDLSEPVSEAPPGANVEGAPPSDISPESAQAAKAFASEHFTPMNTLRLAMFPVAPVPVAKNYVIDKMSRYLSKKVPQWAFMITHPDDPENDVTQKTLNQLAVNTLPEMSTDPTAVDPDMMGMNVLGNLAVNTSAPVGTTQAAPVSPSAHVGNLAVNDVADMLGTSAGSTGPSGTSGGGASAGFGNASNPGSIGQGGHDAGTGDGGSGEGTVLCTELHRQGGLSDDIYQADSAVGKKMPDLVLFGYHLWAVPVARAMRRSRIVTGIFRPFITAWAYKMAGHRNPLGSLIFWVGVPLCWLIGKARKELCNVRLSCNA